MLSCTDALPLIARHADGDVFEEASRALLEEHLTLCADCRAALSEQRAVASVLRSRPVDSVSPLFSSRLSQRLDEASGWFGIADWQAWTFRLAPVAGAVILATFFFSEQPASTPLSLEEWAISIADSTSPATLLWDSEITSESLLEALVTGSDVQDSAGSGDVR